MDISYVNNSVTLILNFHSEETIKGEKMSKHAPGVEIWAIVKGKDEKYYLEQCLFRDTDGLMRPPNQ